MHVESSTLLFRGCVTLSFRGCSTLPFRGCSTFPYDDIRLFDKDCNDISIGFSRTDEKE